MFLLIAQQLIITENPYFPRELHVMVHGHMLYYEYWNFEAMS